MKNEILTPKFYFGQRVKVIGGFNRNRKGRVTEYFQHNNEYKIESGWEMFPFDRRSFIIKEEHLESL